MLFQVYNGLPRLATILAVVFVVVLCENSESSLTARMRNISEDLHRKLELILDEQNVVYSSVNMTGLPYNATTKFCTKGMGQLYNITNRFIDLIQNKQAFPEGLLRIENRSIKVADPKKEWKIIATHYGGVAGLGLAGLIVAAILPCVGLFFCCCRCAGRCGAKREPFDKKHDQCKKVMLGILLITVTTMLLYGVVCAFVTNEYMQTGTKDLVGNVNTSVKDVKLYLTMTKKEIHNLLVVNFNELETKLNHILQLSGKIVTEKLLAYSNAVSLTNLHDIVMALSKISKDLEMMNSKTNEIRVQASQLNDKIRSVRYSIALLLKECNSQCDILRNKYKIDELNTKMDFDHYLDRYFPKLPDVTDALRNITKLVDNHIVDEVSKGEQAFRKIQNDIQYAVNNTIPTVSRSIRNAGRALEVIANNITNIIDRFSAEIDSQVTPALGTSKRYINQYSPYRHYLGLGMSGTLLIIFMCLTCGLFCGICGKRPDGYGDDCCNKGSGARFLMTAVWLIFLLTSIMIVLTMAHMAIGITAQRGICEPLKNPNDSRLFKLVDEFFELKSKLFYAKPEMNINMSYIIQTCHRNESLYNVLLLHQLVDLKNLSEYVERYDINSNIEKLKNKINLTPNVVILTVEARRKLELLADSGLGEIKFDRYANVLRENITNMNLLDLAEKMDEVAENLTDNYREIKRNLSLNANTLRSIHKSLVVPMTETSEMLMTTAENLQETIKFNHSSIQHAIRVLIDQVQHAQDYLNDSGPQIVHKTATQFGKAFIELITDFLDRVVSSAFNNVGRCAPVSNAYNATLVAGCNRILDPFNGFWLSVGWSLLFFIPAIVLSVKLSTLYHKSDPYPDPSAEAEYLYDAYADRDNMPLANVPDKKYVHGRYHPGHYHDGYHDGPAHYSDRERIGDPHQGSSHHDSRYSDIAPKNWDFPNGGPPRYQPASASHPLSTEYERPPPYYYPGPGDRN